MWFWALLDVILQLCCIFWLLGLVLPSRPQICEDNWLPGWPALTRSSTAETRTWGRTFTGAGAATLAGSAGAGSPWSAGTRRVLGTATTPSQPTLRRATSHSWSGPTPGSWGWGWGSRRKQGSSMSWWSMTRLGTSSALTPGMSRGHSLNTDRQL